MVNDELDPLINAVYGGTLFGVVPKEVVEQVFRFLFLSRDHERRTSK